MDKNLLRAQLLMEAADLLNEEYYEDYEDFDDCKDFEELDESVEANNTKIIRMLKECFRNVKRITHDMYRFIDDDGNKIIAKIAPTVVRFDSLRDKMRDKGGRLAKIADSGFMKIRSRDMNTSENDTAATGANIIMLGSELARVSPNQFRSIVYHEIGHLRLSHVGTSNANSEDNIPKTMLKNTPRRSRYSFNQRVNFLTSANDEDPFRHAIYGSKYIKDGTSEKASKRKEVFSHMARSIHGGIGHGIAIEGEADEYSRQHGGNIDDAIRHVNDIALKKMKKDYEKRATDMGGKILAKHIVKSVAKDMKKDTKARQKMARSVKPEYKNLYKNF